MARSFVSSRKTPKTAVERVYEGIRIDILNGVHPQGSHLVRQAMAKKYNVSAIPVMEAFYRLEMDGLVENSPSQGTYVIEVSDNMIEQDRLLREALECQSARLFTLRASDHEKNDIRELGDLLDSMQEIIAREGEITEDKQNLVKQFLKYHADFHFGIAKMSGAAKIDHLIRMLWRRRVMVIDNIPTVLRALPERWHAALADQFLSGDPDAAERQMRAHVNYHWVGFDESLTGGM